MCTLASGGVPPSFEELCAGGTKVHGHHDLKKLFWTLNGPMSTSVWIMDDVHDRDSNREEYFRQTPEGPGWHPISQLPLTEPKVSSLTVIVNDLHNWEENWVEFYSAHADPDFTECIYGPLPDYDPDSVEEGSEHLLSYFGEERPRKKKVKLLVKASSEFVTVHDYISAVHPWLMGLRGDILGAIGVFYGGLPSETRLVVDCCSLGVRELKIEEETTWFHDKKGADARRLWLESSIYRTTVSDFRALDHCKREPFPLAGSTQSRIESQGGGKFDPPDQNEGWEV